MSSSGNKDERWSAFATDPKFRPVPRKERKVAIDDRFKSMFSDKRFVNKVKVDKRGRPTKHRSTKEDYKRYYRMQDEQDSDDDDDDDSDNDSGSDGDSSEDERNSMRKLGTKPEVFTASSNDSSEIEFPHEDEQQQQQQDEVAEHANEDSDGESGDKKLDTKLKGKLKDLSVNYARGEGNLADSSSSEESDSDSDDDEVEEEEEEEVEEQFDKWGELDHDAETTEVDTSRLAVCNMDWDRVDADDIFVALNSFCPVGGGVKRVRVFVSEYGKKRLEEEDRLGPEELRARDEKEAGEEMEEEFGAAQDQEEIERRAMERVRRYQVRYLLLSLLFSF